jgi:GTP-binding protein
VDKQLAEYVLNEHKPAVFVVNKWDLVKHAMATESMADYIRKMFPMLDYVPIAFITAQKGKNVLRLLQLAVQLHKQAGTRVSTGDLNRVVRAAMDANTPPMRFNRVPKVFYATQIGVHPPTVVLFTNGPDLFDDTYVRYLTKCLRDAFPFSEVAIRVILRAKGESGGHRRGDGEDAPPPAPVTEDSGEMQILRNPPRPAPPPEPEPGGEPTSGPKPRKKKPGNPDTWDF